MDITRGLSMGGRIFDFARHTLADLAWMESRFYKNKLEEISLKAPIFVCGLARSGSTMILEILNSHTDTSSHLYRDFPPLFIPLFWDSFLGSAKKKDYNPVERAHHDRIKVTPDSPEAFEEVIWMHFSDVTREGWQVSLLDYNHQQPDGFETFYTDHVKKIILLRGGQRYLAKNNPNIARIPYLLRLFPQARFVVPVRNPIEHIASLIKQHRLFSSEESGNPDILKHMRRIGHFEFGLDRRVIRMRNQENSHWEKIENAWNESDDVKGYALQWEEIYGGLLEIMASNPEVNEAVHIVSYDKLCEDSDLTLNKLFSHCRLTDSENIISKYADTLSKPDYYKHSFTSEQLQTIKYTTDNCWWKISDL